MTLRKIVPREDLCEYASRTLFERYKEFKGWPAKKICEAFSIEIREVDIAPSFGFLTLGRHEPLLIEISQRAELEELKEFVIYHELAHLFLIFIGVSFRKSEAEYDKCEAWCDNFALAMLLARFGHEVVNDISPCEFFLQGEGITGESKDKRIAERLLEYCKGDAWADHESELSPLFRLSVKLSKK